MCKIVLFTIIHVQNQIFESFYCSLQHMLLGVTRARGDTKYQNFDSFYEDR